MATIFDVVRALNPNRHNWRLCFRVVRMWNMPARHGPGDASSMELVMQDIHYVYAFRVIVCMRLCEVDKFVTKRNI
ncbi:hypothetical protein K1719_003626 [Acacia pycnantha]|nr:hypothetical protein K1719_003626 [Acacia pycnantha]